MTRNGHDIVKDLKGQEQPANRDAAQRVSKTGGQTSPSSEKTRPSDVPHHPARSGREK
jgi:hypothetical protein